DPTQWNPHPIRSVVELIRQLIERLLRLEEPQQRAGVLRIAGQNLDLRFHPPACGGHPPASLFPTPASHVPPPTHRAPPQISTQKRLTSIALPSADTELARRHVELLRLHTECRRGVGERS